MWNNDFNDISIKLENHIVRVKNDAALKTFLKAKRGNSRVLAEHILDRYHKEYGYALRITKRSLATELVMHYLVQEIVLWKDRLTQKTIRRRLFPKISDFLLLHMDVIDCGERYEDNNRAVWDLLSLSVPAKKRPHEDIPDSREDSHSENA